MFDLGRVGNRMLRTITTPLAVSPVVGWSLAASAAAAFALVLMSGTTLGDPDTHWHIAVGRWIMTNGAMPRTDTFSYTFAGQPWIAKEWLSQVILMAAYSCGGWSGLVLLTDVIVAITLYILMRDSGRRHGPGWGLLVGLIVVVFIGPTLVARPHLLAFPIIVLWTMALARGAETGRPPWLALPLLALWANLHAGFAVGLLIAAAMGLEAMMRAAPDRILSVIGRWSIFGLACAVACVSTPYGIEPILVSAKVAGGVESMRALTEWQPLAVNGTTALMVTVAGLAIAALAQRPRENAGRILVLLILGIAMVRYARFTMLFGLVAPVLAGSALFHLVQAIARRLDVFQKPVLPAATWTPHVAAGLATAALAVLLVDPPRPGRAVTPDAALAAVPAELRRSHVFNSYSFGGFLIGNGIPTFIDGRSDQLFLGGFMTAMFAATEASDPNLLADLLDRHRIDWAIVATDYPEVQLFPRLPGWRRLHKDKTAHIYVRDDSRRAATFAP